jgi:hypothetical protein
LTAQQGHAVVFLQIVDLFGYGRLSQIKNERRFSKVFRLTYGSMNEKICAQ